MEIILIKIIGGFFLLIFLLLLSELGLLKKWYEEIYTHPESTKVKIFFAELTADIFYVIGGSAVASTVFMLITTKSFSVPAFTFGLAFAIIGKYLKEK
ncbi:hypothetical protein [Sulfurimonas indica]|uniref:hypothetical protein n=1 Tax=Sulfurimonas TaxID=202746 RepID=UPI00126582F3|nr:hypothetical protein [Sulfurimonas indica]